MFSVSDDLPNIKISKKNKQTMNTENHLIGTALLWNQTITTKRSFKESIVTSHVCQLLQLSGVGHSGSSASISPYSHPSFLCYPNIYLSSFAVSINLQSCSFPLAGLLHQLGFASLPPSPNSSVQTNPVHSSQLWVTLYWTGLNLFHTEAENVAWIKNKKNTFSLLFSI